MIEIKKPSECAGCTACVMTCVHGAINMEHDALGFMYPKVDPEKCIECGACEKICPFHEGYDALGETRISIVAFAARHKEVSEVETSRSGAVFVALSDIILEQGGSVYGAGFSDAFRVVHKRAMTKKARNEFKGSKYVQSELGEIFLQVRTDLQSGLKVLFSGTPCQTAGLNAFIGKRLRKNLYLVDIVCHGVASPFVWKDYLSYLQCKEKDEVVSVNFRDKKIFGWSGLHKESFVFKRKGLKTFDYTFYHPYMLRESCNVCHFSNLNRPSDITLGDFWGWRMVVPDFVSDDKGLSLVLCNSHKGIDLFTSISDKLDIREVDIKMCMQPNLKHPTPMDYKRLKFEVDYKSHGFRYVMRKYGNVGISYQLARVFRFIARKLNMTTVKL